MTITVEGPGGATVEFPDGTSTETINQVMTQHFGGSKEPSGVAAGLNKGTADAINAVKATAKNYFGAGDGPSPEDPNYVPANVTNGSLNPLKWNYDQLPQKAAELAPGIAEQLVAAKGGAKVGKSIGGLKGAALGALLASGASLWANSAGNAAKQDAVDRTGDQNAEPNASDLTRAGLTSAASAAVQSALPARFTLAPKITNVGGAGALDAIKKYLANVGVAGAAGAAGKTVDQIGNTIGTDKGVTINPSEAGDAALGNMAVVGALGAPRLAAETTQAANRANFGGGNEQATAAYIKRLTDAAGSEGLGSGKKDFTAQENAKAGLRNELKAVDHYGMDQDTQNALNLARGGKPLTAEDVSTIEAADPQAGFLARQLHMAQHAEGFGTYDTSNKTWAGGVSGKMDKLMRNYVDPTKVLTGVAAGHVLGLHLLGTASPAFAGAAVGTYGLARAADSLAGLRSPAKAFAERFQDAAAQTRLPAAAPQQPPAPPSQPSPGPWGPRPLAQQSVPQVQPQAPAAPQPQINPIALKMAMANVKKNANGGLAPQAPTAPPMPQINPIALKMAQANIKQNANGGLEPQAPAAPAAPPAPSFNPIALKMLAQKLADGQKQGDANYKANVNQAFSENKTLNKDYGANQAQAVSENKARDALAAAALKASAPQPTAAPVATNGSTAPAITTPTKISKKAGGKVQVTQPTPQAEPTFDWGKVGGYTPGQQENPFRGKTPQEIARISTDAMQGLPELRKLSYFNNTLGTRTARDNVISELKQAFPGEQSILDELRQDLHAPGNSDQAQSMRVVKHYTSLMSADVGEATRAAFRRADVRDAVWPPAKAKTNGKSKKAPEEVQANQG